MEKENQGILRSGDWGIERSNIKPRGNEICTPAPYAKSNKIKRKFKILTSDLIDLGYVV